MCVKAGSPEYYERVTDLLDLDATIKSGQANGLHYLWRGGCYQELQMLEAAAEDYTTALSFASDLEPKRVGQIYDSRSVCYFRLRRYDEALIDGEYAVQLAPTVPRYWANLGRAYSIVGRYDEAFTHYAKACEIDPTDSWAINFRAKTYDTLDQPEGVSADVALSLTLPGIPTAILYMLRAKNYLKLGQYENAERDCTIGLAPDTLERDLEAPSLYDARGWARYHLGKFQESLADFMDVVRLVPNAVYAHLGMGLVYHKLGLTAGADQAFRQFTRLHPDGALVALRDIATYLERESSRVLA